MTDPARVGTQGHPPVVTVGAGNPEATKYGRLWTMDAYRKVAPGEALAQVFLQHARPKPGASVIDFGCGTGRGAFMLALLGGLKVTMVDFVNNCLDDDIRQMLTTQAHALAFVKADLEQPLPVAAEYGFCTDVMEHIPPDKVHVVLNHILRAAQHVFFAIATVDDVCGKLIGEPLHLSVHPYAWWLDRFKERECVVHWSAEVDGAALFYVTAWVDGPTAVNHGMLNTPEDEVLANIRQNIAGPWMQVMPYLPNDEEVMILGGGPSLALFEDEIKAKRAAGHKLVTLNGAYPWALEHGLTPSATIVVDARPFNKRFVTPIIEDCRYLIASQVHPSVLEGLPEDRTFLWHSGGDLVKEDLDARYDLWWTIPGGTTVLLRAIPMLRMLGFRRFHLYGCDSCLMDGAHHAYAQPENDSTAIAVTAAGRTFWCHPWMFAQAESFMDLIRAMGEDIELQVAGDGLLAWLLQAAAAKADGLEPMIVASTPERL